MSAASTLTADADAAPGAGEEAAKKEPKGSLLLLLAGAAVTGQRGEKDKRKQGREEQGERSCCGAFDQEWAQMLSRLGQQIT